MLEPTDNILSECIVNVAKTMLLFFRNVIVQKSADIVYGDSKETYPATEGTVIW